MCVCVCVCVPCLKGRQGHQTTSSRATGPTYCSMMAPLSISESRTIWLRPSSRQPIERVEGGGEFRGKVTFDREAGVPPRSAPKRIAARPSLPHPRCPLSHSSLSHLARCRDRCVSAVRAHRCRSIRSRGSQTPTLPVIDWKVRFWRWKSKEEQPHTATHLNTQK